MPLNFRFPILKVFSKAGHEHFVIIRLSGDDVDIRAKRLMLRIWIDDSLKKTRVQVRVLERFGEAKVLPDLFSEFGDFTKSRMHCFHGGVLILQVNFGFIWQAGFFQNLQ